MSNHASRELDIQVAAGLKQALSLLHRALSEGVGVQNFPITLEVGAATLLQQSWLLRPALPPQQPRLLHLACLLVWA